MTGTPSGAMSGMPSGAMAGAMAGTVAEAPPRYHAEPINRAALRRPGGPAAPVCDGVYRTRRPAAALALAALVVLLEAPALRLLLDGTFGGPPSAPGIVAGMLLAVGLPITAVGGYALVSGAARVPDQHPAHAWLRPPLAYLVIGVALLLAAGLAAA
jgi:hypothetical protein